MVKVTKDGRTIRTGKDYTHFRELMHERAFYSCETCYQVTFLHFPPECNGSFHVHHKNGRGMGGSRRDDTFEACVGLCGRCHRKVHNQ